MGVFTAYHKKFYLCIGCSLQGAGTYTHAKRKKINNKMRDPEKRDPLEFTAKLQMRVYSWY